MKKTIPGDTYKLIPSQETMYFMVKYSIHKQVVQVPTSVTVGMHLDFDLLKKALNIEIERNDCMRLRFVKVNGEIRQYFLPMYHVSEVPVKVFKSALEQKEYFDADAQTPVKFLKDETFRVVFFKSHDGKSGVFLNACHLIMDAAAATVFYMDLFAIYNALATGAEMPKPLNRYEDYIKTELTKLQDKKRYNKGRDFYMDFWIKDGEPFYAGVHGHDILDKARKKKKNPDLRVPAAYDPINDKADLIFRHVDAEKAEKIFDYCKKTGMAPECMFQMGFRTHVAAINYRTDNVLMMQLCSKRITVKDKWMGGCLTQPLQMRTVMSEDMTFDECLKKIFSTRAQLYRHVDFPYMDARKLQQKIYNFGMTEAPSSLMYTWLPVPMASESGIDFEFTGYNLGRYIMPLYVFSYPNMKNGGIDFFYMYRVNMIKANQINSLHDNGLNLIMKGIDNPSITLGELMDADS